jgi:hypothetical protein
MECTTPEINGHMIQTESPDGFFHKKLVISDAAAADTNRAEKRLPRSVFELT